MDGAVRVWNVETRECVLTLEGHRCTVYSVAFNHNGTKLVSGASDHTVRIWDLKTGKCVLTLAGHTNIVKLVVFSHDSTMILSSSFDNTICLWDSGTGNLIRRLTGHRNAVSSVAFSPDDTKLTFGSWNTVSILPLCPPLQCALKKTPSLKCNELAALCCVTSEIEAVNLSKHCVDILSTLPEDLVALLPGTVQARIALFRILSSREVTHESISVNRLLGLQVLPFVSGRTQSAAASQDSATTTPAGAAVMAYAAPTLAAAAAVNLDDID